MGNGDEDDSSPPKMMSLKERMKMLPIGGGGTGSSPAGSPKPSPGRLSAPPRSWSPRTRAEPEKKVGERQAAGESGPPAQGAEVSNAAARPADQEAAVDDRTFPSSHELSEVSPALSERVSAVNLETGPSPTRPVASVESNTLQVGKLSAKGGVSCSPSGVAAAAASAPPPAPPSDSTSPSLRERMKALEANARPKSLERGEMNAISEAPPGGMSPGLAERMKKLGGVNIPLPGMGMPPKLRPEKVAELEEPAGDLFSSLGATSPLSQTLASPNSLSMSETFDGSTLHHPQLRRVLQPKKRPAKVKGAGLSQTSQI